MGDVEPAIAVHGGAGHLGSDDPASSGGPDAPRLAGVRSAARAALDLLLLGGSALDAVELAVRALEDDATYNAGTGACLTAAGDVELDAAVQKDTEASRTAAEAALAVGCTVGQIVKSIVFHVIDYSDGRNHVVPNAQYDRFLDIDCSKA